MACGCSKKQNENSEKSFLTNDCYIQAFIRDGGSKYWVSLTFDNFEYLYKNNPNKFLDIKYPDCYDKMKNNIITNETKLTEEEEIDETLSNEIETYEANIEINIENEENLNEKEDI